MTVRTLEMLRRFLLLLILGAIPTMTIVAAASPAFAQDEDEDEEDGEDEDEEDEGDEDEGDEDY